MEGKGGAIRHVTYAPPPGTFIPASPLVYSSTQIKVPVDSRISDNSQRGTTQQRHNLTSKLGAQEVYQVQVVGITRS